MKLIWVSGTLPLSKFIMWGLKEPVSHFAIVFDDKIVFHSDLTGVHISWYNTFLKSHTVVFELDHSDAALELQEQVYQNIINQYDGKWYDYGAFLYFIWRGTLKRFFGKAMPEKNPWGSKSGFLCTEMIQTLPDEMIPAPIKAADLSMKSPYELWLMLQPLVKSAPELQDPSSK